MDNYDKMSVIIAVLVITSIILLVIFLGPQSIEWQEAGDKCKNEAHELGFRYIDYVYEFDECWAQRPDGSIVDLFKEGNT